MTLKKLNQIDLQNKIEKYQEYHPYFHLVNTDAKKDTCNSTAPTDTYTISISLLKSSAFFKLAL